MGRRQPPVPKFDPKDLFALTWVHDMRFGETFYRLRAVSGVLRSYRRRPARFVVEIEVRWGYDDPFRHFDKLIAEHHLRTDLDNVEMIRRLNDLHNKRNEALDRLPTKTYLMTGAADTNPTFELIKPILVPSQWGSGFDVRESAGTLAAIRLKEKLNQGWAHMLASGSQRYFREVPGRLMNQMVFDKMADPQWPSAPRETRHAA